MIKKITKILLLGVYLSAFLLSSQDQNQVVNECDSKYQVCKDKCFQSFLKCLTNNEIPKCDGTQEDCNDQCESIQQYCLNNPSQISKENDTIPKKLKKQKN